MKKQMKMKINGCVQLGVTIKHSTYLAICITCTHRQSEISITWGFKPSQPWRVKQCISTKGTNSDSLLDTHSTVEDWRKLGKMKLIEPGRQKLGGGHTHPLIFRITTTSTDLRYNSGYIFGISINWRYRIHIHCKDRSTIQLIYWFIESLLTGFIRFIQDINHKIPWHSLDQNMVFQTNE